MKLIKRFQTHVIPQTEKALKKEEDLLFYIENIKAVHGDKNGLQGIIIKHQQSIFVLKQRLKEYQSLIKRISK